MDTRGASRPLLLIRYPITLPLFCYIRWLLIMLLAVTVLFCHQVLFNLLLPAVSLLQQEVHIVPTLLLIAGTALLHNVPLHLLTSAATLPQKEV
jgi:uncharacterized protein (DUF58 family)